jgi:hypothetical protein
VGGGIKRLVAEALMLGSWQSNFIKLVYFVFWFPFLAIIVITLALITKNIKSLLIHNTFNMLLLPIYISIIILMSINRGDDSYFVIYSLFILLVFVLVIRFGKQSCAQSDNNKKISSAFVLLCLVLMVFMHTSVHSVKFLFSSEKYYYAPAVYKAVTNSLNPEDTLFVTRTRQLPVFYDYLDAKYSGDSGVNNIFIVRVIPANDCDKIGLVKSLRRNVERIKHDRTVWGFWKRSLNIDHENMRVTYNYGLRPKNSSPLYIHFNVKSIIYEDKDHLFIRPEMITFDE